MKTVPLGTLTTALDALTKVLNQGKRKSPSTQLSLLSYGTYYVGSVVTMYDIDHSFLKDFEDLLTCFYAKVMDEATLESAYAQLMIFCRRVRGRLEDLA